jgi:hypothetical protein
VITFESPALTAMVPEMSLGYVILLISLFPCFKLGAFEEQTEHCNGWLDMVVIEHAGLRWRAFRSRLEAPSRSVVPPVEYATVEDTVRAHQNLAAGFLREK